MASHLEHENIRLASLVLQLAKTCAGLSDRIDALVREDLALPRARIPLALDRRMSDRSDH